MAITLEGTATPSGQNTTTFTIVLPVTQAGDIIIVEFTHRGTGNGTWTGTYTGPSFTQKHKQLFATSAFSGQTWWSRATGNHSGQTVIVSGLTNSCAGVCAVYRGALSSGDPLSDATVVGEENASGNETQAQITTATAGAWVVLLVSNSPDFDVSAQACTSPTLVERVEKLSSGGTDTSTSHASGEKASAGATGAFTWSQTDSPSGSWAYAIKPAAVITEGTLAATETADTAALAGDVIVSGSLAATEVPDTAAVSGAVYWIGTLGAIEGVDLAAFSGTVSEEEITGALAAVEVTDSASVAGTVLVAGAMSSTEGPDAPSLSGTVLVSGPFAGIEAQDSFAALGGVLVSATLVAVESPDVASFAGIVVVPIEGMLSTTEPADVAAFAGDAIPIVMWTALINVIAEGHTITKTSGGNGYNAAAISILEIASNGRIDFTAKNQNNSPICGLGHANTGAGFSDIDFGLQGQLGGGIAIFENGWLTTIAGSYVQGDTLSVLVDGPTVTYLHNGVLIYTSAKSPTYPLHADCSIYYETGWITATMGGDFVGAAGGKAPARIRLVSTYRPDEDDEEAFILILGSRQ